MGQRLKRPTTLDFHDIHTLGAGHGNKRLQGFFDAQLRWAQKECETFAEIYENCTFHTFQSLSVEIVEEKNRQKVIHSQFNSPCSSLVTRHFGRTQVALINM